MAKVVLVTGGSSGIGRSVAAYLAKQGHTVYGTSRNASDHQTADFRLLSMDVTNEESVNTAIEHIIKAHGRLDVLVNNAGLGMAGPLESTTDEEARLIFDTNVFGVLNTCRAAAPYLRASTGTVINITSIGGVFGLPFRGIYCASKFAVEGISEVLSMELGTHGVKVVIVQPGDFKTNINNNRLNAAQIDTSVYPHFKGVLEQIHREVHTAQDTELMGRAIAYIMSKKNPRLRYRVAPTMQRLSVLLNYVIPGRIFERLLVRHYKMNKGRKD
jgi:NAD(P)-dependent dehydrogenase (short-subunit alcohol dehydrogenase family)